MVMLEGCVEKLVSFFLLCYLFCYFYAIIVLFVLILTWRNKVNVESGFISGLVHNRLILIF